MPLVENNVFKINGSPVSHICYLTTGGSTVFIVMRNERGQYFFQAMITAQLRGEQLREICKAIIGKWEVEIVSLGILRTDELKFISEDVAPCFVREAARILKVIDY